MARRPQLTHAARTTRAGVHDGFLRAALAIGCVLALSVSTLASRSFAEDAAQNDLLIRMLASSSDARVRVQAALALSHRPATPQTLAALRQALADSHPAVRKASGEALASLSPVAPEPRSTAQIPAKYYVQIGPTSADTAVPASVLRNMRTGIERAVAPMAGVRIAPQGEATDAAKRVLERDALVGYFLESVIRRLEQRPDGTVRVEVAVVVASYPGRDIRAMLTGAASAVIRPQDERAMLELAHHAVASALRRLPQVLDTSRLEARASRTARRER